MVDELTDAAKAAIADAVRIVREDKMDKWIRDRMVKHSGTPPTDPPKPPDPPTPPTPPTPTDPPVPPPPTPTDPPKPPEKRRSGYWGELDE